MRIRRDDPARDKQLEHNSQLKFRLDNPYCADRKNLHTALHNLSCAALREMSLNIRLKKLYESFVGPDYDQPDAARKSERESWMHLSTKPVKS